MAVFESTSFSVEKCVRSAEENCNNQFPGTSQEDFQVWSVMLNTNPVYSLSIWSAQLLQHHLKVKTFFFLADVVSSCKCKIILLLAKNQLIFTEESLLWV